MNNILLFIAALLVLALSALFAAPYFIDWNEHRPVFEEQASRLIGRKVNVGGNVSLTFLPAPVLRFENVNVADPEGSFDTPFLSARSFTVWLSVPPLLRGAIEAREVELDQPVLNLQLSEEGAGNWRDVGRSDVTLPFAPRSVALDSVKISDATVTLARSSGEPYLVLNHFDGGLSARSLQGPYKFSGTFETGGGERELRFSTSRREGDAPVRLKAVVRNAAGSEFYQVDGDLSGLDAVPHFEGNFVAGFHDPSVPADKRSETITDQATAPVAVKAHMDAGPEKASFSGLEITVRRSDKPQTIVGKVDLAYGDGLAVNGNLSSRWVDLDLLAGGKATGGPGDALGAISRAALSFAALTSKSRFTLALEQAVLAGDLLSDVEVKAEKDGSDIVLRDFSAQLPGDSRVSLQGRLKSQDGAPSFTGPIAIVGEKPNRLLAWSGFQMQQIVAAQEGGFDVKGALAIAPGSIDLKETVGQLFGSSFSGALRYSSGERQLFELTYESERLDISSITGSDAKPFSLPGLMSALSRQRKEDAPQGPLAGLGEAEVRIDLDVGALTLPGLGESSLAGGLHFAGGDIDIRALKLRSDTGLELQASGNLTEQDGQRRGSITISADASSAKGVEALAGLMELGDIVEFDESRLEALTPTLLTAAVRSSNETETGLSVHMEGTLGGSDVTFDASLAGAVATWREGKVSVDASVTNKSSHQMLSQFFRPVPDSHGTRFEDEAGRLRVAMSGTPESGLKAKSAIRAAGITWKTQGTLKAVDSGFEFNGEGELEAVDGLALMSLGGLRIAPGRSGKPVMLRGKIASSRGIYAFDDLAGTSGQESFNGSARLDASGASPHLDLDIEASSASLPFLLEPLLIWDDPFAEPPDTIRGATRTAGFWPEHLIDAALLTSIGANVKIKAEQLHLAGALMLAGAQVEAKIDDGVLEISRLDGALYGGTLKASARLAAQVSGLTFSAKATASGLRLEKIVPGNGDDTPVRGPVDLDISLQGSGLSPHGLAAGLNGEGELKFDAGEIARLAAQAPKLVADELQAEGKSGPVDEAKLMQALRTRLKESSFSYKPFTAGIEINNGIARIEKVRIESAGGRAAVTTFLEFPALKVDSEWVLSSDGDSAGEGRHVVLAFIGPLGQLGQLSPEIDTQALQRYVTIHRMEQDVERLEKLEVPGAQGDPEKPAPLPQPPAAQSAPTPPPAAGLTPPPAPEPSPDAIQEQAPDTQAVVPPADLPSQIFMQSPAAAVVTVPPTMPETQAVVPPADQPAPPPEQPAATVAVPEQPPKPRAAVPAPAPVPAAPAPTPTPVSPPVSAPPPAAAIPVQPPPSRTAVPGAPQPAQPPVPSAAIPGQSPGALAPPLPIPRPIFRPGGDAQVSTPQEPSLPWLAPEPSQPLPAAGAPPRPDPEPAARRPRPRSPGSPPAGTLFEQDGG